MNFVFLKLNHTNFHDFTFNLNLAKIILERRFKFDFYFEFTYT